MDRHGAPEYVIVGESPLPSDLTAQMRSAARADAGSDGLAGTNIAHDAGSDADTSASADEAGAAAATATVPFRFSRLGPNGSGHQLSPSNLKKLALAMTRTSTGQSGIPAGFTYLGQFIDHDLTMDVTKVMLGEHVTPATLLQARSPSLDLDSLYGAGPHDPASAKFYQSDGVHLKMGASVGDGDLPDMDGFDLPRRGTGSSARAKRRAVVPDARNDENLAVAQTHLAMIRFHNRVVDTLPADTPPAQRFAKARKIVVKHYQWMIRTDFLPRICSAAVVNDVFGNGRKVFEIGAAPTDIPTMPVEFSIAAYRHGHSMVREAYNWNKIFDDGGGSLELLFEFSGTSGTLGGDVRLPSIWIADFRRLYDFAEVNRPGLTVPDAKFNRARRIDTRLSSPLRNLPTGSFGGPAVDPGDLTANLAFRNLMRARMVRLGTGQQMAAHMAAQGVAVDQLTRDEIEHGRNGASLESIPAAQRRALLRDTPLWFYVLREAELHRGKLHGVGARIVAETMHRAMEGSRWSIVRDTAFRPTLGPDDSTFRMTDLLLFAFEGKKSLLAPLG